MPRKQNRSFRRCALITLLALYLLILVGGIVRASGAGMGCPDWPTCFGQWIPPTRVTQLPANYHEIYAHLGYRHADFNVVKTWTEYLNRLLGVIIGGMIFATAIFATPLFKVDKPIAIGAWAAFLLVGAQGWLGSWVVATNLTPWVITLHMWLALAIVGVLIYTVVRAQRNRRECPPAQILAGRIPTVLLIAMAATLMQLTLGTQVREAVDHIAELHDWNNRELWRAQLPWWFYLHKAFAPVILFVNLWLAYRIAQYFAAPTTLFRAGLTLGILTILAVVSGLTLDRFGLPAAIQPIHLTIASLIFGNQFFLFMHLRYALRAPNGSNADSPTTASA